MAWLLTLRRKAAGLAHRYVESQSEGPIAHRCLGNLYPLRPAMPPAQPDRRTVVPASWVGSGELSWGEAEALLALEETTRWRSTT